MRIDVITDNDIVEWLYYFKCLCPDIVRVPHSVKKIILEICLEPSLRPYLPLLASCCLLTAFPRFLFSPFWFLVSDKHLLWLLPLPFSLPHFISGFYGCSLHFSKGTALAVHSVVGTGLLSQGSQKGHEEPGVIITERYTDGMCTFYLKLIP